MQVRILRSVAELDDARWDELQHPSIYLSAGWLRGRSHTLKAAERFVMVTDASGTPLVAVPSYIADSRVHPGFNPPRVLEYGDMTDAEAAMLPEEAHTLGEIRSEMSERSNEWLPALFVGVPGRYGAVSYAHAIPSEVARDALGVAIDAMDELAHTEGARSTSWFYLVRGADPLLEHTLQQRGYLETITEAECSLPLDYADFGAYLDRFRAEGRRKIRYEMATFDRAGASVTLHGAEALGIEVATLERRWRVKYGRMPSIEEILGDYEQLRSSLAPNLRVFVASLNDHPIGFVVFLAQGDTWYARFGGFDYSVGNLFLYFNLLFYRPIQAMIERRVKCAQYSFKSYEAKRSRGCELHDVVSFLRPPPGWPHLGATLERMNRIQRARFDTISKRRVFREEDVST